MSSADALPTLRPGVASGPYPERADPRPPWLARAFRAAEGWLRVPGRVGRAEVAAFAQEVETAGSAVADATEAGFDTALGELRLALRREGAEPALLPRAFALVREAARRSLGTPHYDVQLYGGRVMARHGLAELETGEGKTLTASLPAAFAALAGIPVHVITANDYLVARDAETLRPLYTRLGLTTGVVVEEDPDRDARRAAYACDVTYVTNKQVAFDYLQDRLAVADSGRLSHRLATSAASAGAGAPVGGIGATGGAAVLRGLCFAIIDEADSVLLDDARTPLILSRGGAPPDERTVRSALWLARSLEVDTHFRVDRRRGAVEITQAGHEQLDWLAQSLRGPLAGPRRRGEWVHRALSALHVFEKDVHYLIRDDAIQTIDQPTGRRSPDRSFEGGMQALLEASEGVPITPQRETIARISYQRFFRRYLRLAGMTGTAREVARELWDVYGLRTVTVPTRLPTQRSALGAELRHDDAARRDAVLERVRALHAAGRPVLVGTATVEASEALSACLAQAGLAHQVLNARQDADEARVVARAGEAGRITVATHMAGRGTDIPLGPGVAEAGGLAVVATDLGDAGRIDRQLFGRCGRQGVAGSTEHWISLEDRLLRDHLPAWLRRSLLLPLFPKSLVIRFTKLAQRAEERRSALARRRLLDSERALEDLLAFSGRKE